VIDGRFGPVMVRVTNVKLEVTKTFDEVKDQLKTEIAAERAAGEIIDIRDSIEDARAGGSKLSEVADKYGLSLVDLPAVDANGKNTDGTAIADLPAGLVAAAFDSAVGLVNDPIEPSRNTFVWYEVDSVTDARDRPLEEVRDKVVAAWTDAERAKKLDATAADIKSKVEGGATMDTVASEAGLDLNSADKVTRATPATGQLSTAAIKAAFDGPKGFVTIADGALPMSKIVLVVDDTTIPPFDPKAADIAQTGEQLSSQLVNDLLAAYITQRQTETNVQINQSVIAAALGVSQPTQ
jgi:peptidyl-prolyl cis-trans isomerase D